VKASKGGKEISKGKCKKGRKTQDVAAKGLYMSFFLIYFYGMSKELWHIFPMELPTSLMTLMMN